MAGSDAVGETWRAAASRIPGRVRINSTPAAARAIPAGHRSTPLPAVRALTGPSTRLPAATYRRRRAVAAGLVVALVLVAWAAMGVFGGGPLLAPERPDPAGGRLQPGATYVVQPGDTMWSLAERLKPGADPRPLVDRLVAGHGGPTLHVGERVRLPT